MEGLNDLMQALSDSAIGYSEKTQIMIKLRSTAVSNKGVLFIANLNKLFHTLELLLELGKFNAKLPEISIHVVEFLSVLIDNADPETEIFLTKFLLIIIPCLSTENAALRKNIVGYISRYLVKTKNYEAVFSSANRFGLESPNWKLRATMLEAIEVWWKLAASNNSGDAIANLTEAKRLLQNIIQRLNDTYELVKTTARKVLLSMAKLLPKTINALIKRLPAIIGAEYRELLIQERIENCESIDDVPVDEEIKEALTSAHCAPRKNIDWPEMDGLIFGVVPDCIMKDLRPTANLKERSIAIEELKRLIAVPSNIEKLEIYFSSFFKYIVQLLADNNYKLSTCKLQKISSFS